MTKKRVGIARLDRGGQHFEILVDPDVALEFKLGKPLGVDKVLVHEEIYIDAKKGLRAPAESLKKAFGTTDARKIAEVIIREGEIPMTAEQRRRLTEEKRRQIVEWISRNCIDVRTKAPVPPQRVESALKQVHAAIDPFRPVEEQIPRILKEIQRTLPIKAATARVAVHVPAAYAQRVRGLVARMGKIAGESFNSDGSWDATVEIPAGMQDVLVSKVNNISRGEANIRVVEVVF
jgi:ribosome maturation protein SDO1